VIRKNDIKTLINLVIKRLCKRPLLFPAILLIAMVNAYVFFIFNPQSSYINNSYGYVRHVEYKLDGSVTYELNIDGKRVLYTSLTEESLSIGDVLLLSGNIDVPDKPTNPGEFNYYSYLKNKGITGVFYSDSLTVIEKSKIGIFLNLVIKACYRIRIYVINMFDEEKKGMVAAVFMGDKSLLDDSIVRAFKLSNCSHLLAVSGTHFAGFLMVVTAILSELHIKKKYAVPLYIFFCVLLGCFTGWSESVTRAAVMSSCSYASRDYLSGMSLASIIMFFANPFACMSMGFKMSFIAALFIRLFSERITDLMLTVGFSEIQSKLLTPVAAATLGMMPFWIENTYCFSAIHLLTQLLGSFIASLACIFFLPSVITGMPFACEFLLELLGRLMQFCSSYSFSGFTSRDIPSYLLYSLFIFILIQLTASRLMRKYLMFPSIVILGISVGFCIYNYSNQPLFRVIFPDVGQGDCCLIISNNKSILIDGGVEAEGEYTLVSLLDYYGLETVDIAIATHMDEDHIGGLNYLNSIGRIERLLTCYDLKRGDVITVTNDLSLRCLWPIEVSDGGNEDSVVIMLESNCFTLLLTGDIGFDSEYELDNMTILDCDVLKVGHHGSRYSTSKLFLSACTPEIAIISVGRYNSYGHPSRDTLNRLSEVDVDVFRTDVSGCITINVYESEYLIEEFISK